MEKNSKINRDSRAAGLLFLRALLGIIFFIQGFGRLFVLTVPKVYRMFFKEFENTFLLGWLITVLPITHLTLY